MRSDLLAAEADYSRRFPNKRVVVRDPEWSHGMIYDQYLRDWNAEADTQNIVTAGKRLRPNIVVVEPSDESVFVETNSHGMYGPEIDRSKILVAVWGDSVVEGWRRGWIEGLSQRFPGYQILNGGVGGASISLICQRALEMNRRLPIRYNAFFPGFDTIELPVPANQLLYYWLNRMIDDLPNVILCTQPTPLNEAIVAKEITPYLAQKGELTGYRGGFRFRVGVEPTVKNVRAIFQAILAQNEVIHRIAGERKEMRGQHVPVIDFYQRFHTLKAADFREHFVDAANFRVEAYPLVRQAFFEAFSKILNSHHGFTNIAAAQTA